MALSEANARWNEMALKSSDDERKFIQKAMKAGFSLKQSQFMYLFVDMEKFTRNQDIAGIFTRPID